MFIEVEEGYYIEKAAIESVRFLIDFNSNKGIRIRTRSGAEHYKTFSTDKERIEFVKKIIRGQQDEHNN